MWATTPSRRRSRDGRASGRLEADARAQAMGHMLACRPAHLQGGIGSADEVAATSEQRGWRGRVGRRGARTLGHTGRY
jgi:hypothetical protein